MNQREIKFRALLKNEMYEDEYCCETHEMLYTSKDLANSDLIVYYEMRDKEIEDDVILMQYTGLKDKKGVEIYEGDIVRVDGDGLGLGFVEYHESYFRIFRPCVFSVNLCNHTSTNELDPKNNVEVIGNIYENPELLNKED